MKTAKRNIILTAITMIIVFATYFLLRLSGDTAVQEDLMDYINNKIIRAHQLERRAMDHYESVMGENYVNDETLFRKLNTDIIPIYQDFINELANIKPKTGKVEKINRLYIDAANAQYNAFVAMRDALKNNDAKGLLAAQDKLNESRWFFKKMRIKLARLAQKENVRIKENASD